MSEKYEKDNTGFGTSKQVKTSKSNGSKSNFIFCVIALVFCICFFGWLFSDTDSEDRSRDAWVCAQEVVRSNLKSPSSAVFCSYPDARINNKGDNEYWVTGYVDANNSFGTSVRSEFTVTLTLTEYGYKNANCYFGDDSIRLIAGSIADEYGFSDETTEETMDGHRQREYKAQQQCKKFLHK